MFTFLKNILTAVVNFVAAPFIALKNFGVMKPFEQVVTLLGCAVRGIIIASYFVVVPSLLVTLAWVWVWSSLIIGLVYAVAVISLMLFADGVIFPQPEQKAV